MSGGKGRVRGAARAAVSAVVLALCLSGMLAAPPARAATGGCGGQLVKSLPLGSGSGSGEVRVYKSRAQACAATFAREPGVRRPMAVSIQPRGGVPVRDAGQFTRYAGPVVVGAINRCVYVKGSIGVESVESGWILC